MVSKQEAIESGISRRKTSGNRSSFRLGPGGPRRGFTLVELLVVITIIAMLAGLLLPAANSARARARRTQCENNQRELGLAVMQYESAKGYLPGYVNWFGAPAALPNPSANVNARHLSWVIMVFEELGQPDLWRKWRDNSVTMAQKLDPADVDHYAVVDVPRLKCPADFPEETAALSYVANCGLSDVSMLDANGNLDFTGASNADDVEAIEPIFSAPPAVDLQAAAAVQSPEFGLFFNHNGGTQRRAQASIDHIRDGAAQTVLISENIQASRWAPIDGSGQLRTPTQLDVGMLWWSTNPSAAYGVPTLGDGRLVNDKRDAGSLPPSTASNPRFYARPSSNHPGGAVVMFCDRHAGFVSDQVEYDVYLGMMTPNGEKARKSNSLLIP